MDLWILAKSKLEQAEMRKANLGKQFATTNVIDPNRKRESQVIFCGSRNSGKSSIIHRFLERDEVTKPTMALEYTFGRRTRGTTKEVVNIWELGSDISLSALLSIPLNKKINNSSLVIVLDLTKPEEFWYIFDGITVSIYKQFETIGNSSSFEEKFKDLRTHKDAELITVFPIPLAIIATRYDEFQNFEPELRKNICKFLRFIAHTNGAHLQMYSNRMENLVARTRALISHMSFATNLTKCKTTDYNKPLCIFSPMDSLEDIGDPPVGRTSSDRNIRACDLKTHWQTAYFDLYPRKEKAAIQNSLIKEYNEQEIDSVVNSKNSALAFYIKQKQKMVGDEDKIKQSHL